jgi:transcriptional regulator with XRE-family HTH domain
MLSQIERGQANPTVGVTFRIAQAFGISLAELLEAPGATTSVSVIRNHDRAYHYRSDENCTIRTLSPLNLEKDVEFYELQLKEGSELRSAAHFQGTRESLTVQQGACVSSRAPIPRSSARATRRATGRIYRTPSSTWAEAEVGHPPCLLVDIYPATQLNQRRTTIRDRDHDHVTATGTTTATATATNDHDDRDARRQSKTTLCGDLKLRNDTARDRRSLAPSMPDE